MTFPEAIRAVGAGKRITRKTWKKKGMFVYCTPESTVATTNFRPDVVRYFFQSAGVSMVKINSHIDMRSADGSIIVGWIPPDEDARADDWEILE